MTEDVSSELNSPNPEEQSIIKSFAENLETRRSQLTDKLKEIKIPLQLPPVSLITSKNEFPIYYAPQPEEIEKNTIVPSRIEELKFVVDPAKLTQAVYQDTTRAGLLYKTLILLENDGTVLIQVIGYKAKIQPKHHPTKLFRSILRLSPDNSYSLERVGYGNPTRGGKIIEFFNIKLDPFSNSFAYRAATTQGRILAQTISEEMTEANKFLQR